MSDLNPQKNKKTSQFFQKKGFLLAIVICLCSVSIAGYMSVKSVLEVPDESDWQISAKSNTDEIKNSITPVIIPKDDIKASSNIDSSSNPPSKEKEIVAKSKPIIKYNLPLNGNITKNFSIEVPVFSKTLNDYRAHTGIDIEAKEGDTILSVADGKVTRAVCDELMGYTIEVTDSDGVISSYSGLKDLSFVKVEKELKKGDIIGKIGNPPNFEAIDGFHLHFQMIKDEIPLNPIDMVK